MGGVYTRAFAARHLDRVAGMVLVESSHEAQWAVLPEFYSLKARLMVPLMVPQLVLSRKKARGGSDRRSIVREYRTFKRMTAADRPLAVLSRGSEGPVGSDRLWQAWHGLQRDLAGLSRNSRHRISDSSYHYLNQGDPDLIVTEVIDVVRRARGDAAPGPGRGRLRVEPRDRSE